LLYICCSVYRETDVSEVGCKKAKVPVLPKNRNAVSTDVSEVGCKKA
jgi:hypothetical protein